MSHSQRTGVDVTLTIPDDDWAGVAAVSARRGAHYADVLVALIRIGLAGEALIRANEAIGKDGPR